jgi:hypothetical protein
MKLSRDMILIIGAAVSILLGLYFLPTLLGAFTAFIVALVVLFLVSLWISGVYWAADKYGS